MAAQVPATAADSADAVAAAISDVMAAKAALTEALAAAQAAHERECARHAAELAALQVDLAAARDSRIQFEAAATAQLAAAAEAHAALETCVVGGVGAQPTLSRACVTYEGPRSAHAQTNLTPGDQGACQADALAAHAPTGRRKRRGRLGGGRRCWSQRPA